MGPISKMLEARFWIRAGAALLVLASTPAFARAGDLDDAVLAEINFARANPSEYARELRQAEREDDSGADAEGYGYAPDYPRAVREAIVFLQRQRPLPPLKRSSRLTTTATAHEEAQGPRGEVGHEDADWGSFEARLHRHGVWAGLSGENISYGYWTPRAVVQQLIVDAGVPDRGHRKNIFDAAYQYAGVGCGRHQLYRYMCVIDFAGMLVSR